MASPKKRLDAALVEAGFFDSIEKATRNVMAGLVFVNGHPSSKPGFSVTGDDVLSLAKKEKYVGRGGHKIEAALSHFGINPAGLVCIDVGASTGGFTDCILQQGASFVYAVDVGHNQFDWRLRQDPRVDCREGINARFLEWSDFERQPELAVGDVSFISLTMILPAVFRILPPGADAVFLIKPQFEALRNEVGAGGIVRDEGVRNRCLKKIQNFVLESGHEWLGVMESPIKGRDGNIEYLAHIRTAPNVSKN